MTNLGAHHLDIVDWVLGLEELKQVACVGGRLALDDGGETPDTQDAIFDCGSFTAAWSLRETSRGAVPTNSLEFYGTQGSLGLSRAGFKVTADRDTPAANAIPGVGEHPAGGPQRVAVGESVSLRTKPIDDASGSSDEQYHGHVRNFLDCIRSRKQPISDLASAHRTSTACHLANLAMRLGRSLRWDAAQETIVDDSAAVVQLTRPYRAPWDRELRALGINA
jgi:predicted dehydrogenase